MSNESFSKIEKCILCYTRETQEKCDTKFYYIYFQKTYIIIVETGSLSFGSYIRNSSTMLSYDNYSLKDLIIWLVSNNKYSAKIDNITINIKKSKEELAECFSYKLDMYVKAYGNPNINEIETHVF